MSSSSDGGDGAACGVAWDTPGFRSVCDLPAGHESYHSCTEPKPRATPQPTPSAASGRLREARYEALVESRLARFGVCSTGSDPGIVQTVARLMADTYGGGYLDGLASAQTPSAAPGSDDRERAAFNTESARIGSNAFVDPRGTAHVPSVLWTDVVAYVFDLADDSERERAASLATRIRALSPSGAPPPVKP